MLLKSWATPPASRPIASSFWLWRSCSSSCFWLGHVLGHRDHVRRLAVRVADECGCEVHVHGASVLRHEQRLAPVGVPVAANQLRVQLGAVLAVVRMHVVAGRQPAELLLGVAQERFERAVHGHHRAVDADEQHRGRCGLEHRPEPLLALAQERHGRERAVPQDERRDQGRQEPGIELGECSDGHAEPCEHELDPETGRREEAALAERVPAAQPEHDREQHVVDGDEDGCGEQSGEGERGVSVCADRVRHGPGAESAERVVREIEALDVPRVAREHAPGGGRRRARRPAPAGERERRRR